MKSVLLVLWGLAGPWILAQSPGTFAATGAMRTARSGHTATLLTNGIVLITGGWVSIDMGINLATATAELYDPTSGTFTRTGNMTTPRVFHAAAPLPDGRVLITGGHAEGFVAINSAEIYDPSTGTFAPTGNLVSQHQCQQAHLLGNGKVLIVGGVGGKVDQRAEIYDPATETFAAAGVYYSSTTDTGNTCQAAVSSVLPDGRVLVIWEENGSENYDPATDTFSPTDTDLPSGYSDGLPTATLLQDGKVLIAGGASDPGFSRIAGLYDASTGTFTPTGSMITGPVLHTATLLGDGTVLIGGNYGFGNGPVASGEIYDPVGGTFTQIGDMVSPRCCHTATLLNDGRVLIAGGNTFRTPLGTPTSLAELYTPSSIVPRLALFSRSADGEGQGAILHAGTSRVASPNDPAAIGEALEIYCTGLADGSVVPPQVAIGERLAEVLWYGKAPEFASLNQVNIRVPADVAPGPAVPVRLTYLGRISNQVGIGVQ